MPNHIKSVLDIELIQLSCNTLFISVTYVNFVHHLSLIIYHINLIISLIKDNRMVEFRTMKDLICLKSKIRKKNIYYFCLNSFLHMCVLVSILK